MQPRYVQRQRRTTLAARLGSAWLVATLVLSLLGQSLLVQTHHYFEARFVSAELSTPAPNSTHSSPHSPTDRDGNCPICIEIGHLGLYLAPPVLALQIALTASYSAFLPVALQLVWDGRHDLPRSRGPPHGLLA